MDQLLILILLKLKETLNLFLKSKIDNPEIFYLYLKKEDGDSLNDRILFFGEKGDIKINTILKLLKVVPMLKVLKTMIFLKNIMVLKENLMIRI